MLIKQIRLKERIKVIYVIIKHIKIYYNITKGSYENPRRK